MKTYSVLVVFMMLASGLFLTGLGGDAGDTPIPVAMEPAFADSADDEWDDPNIIKAVDPNTTTFYDPPQGDLQHLTVMRDGWVAYLCDLNENYTMDVKITIIGDHPADIYLFKEVNFQTYKRNPLVTFVPFEADGYKQGATGVFYYSFTAKDTERYFIVIDNKDWPMGTETVGPVNYTISIGPQNQYDLPVANGEILEDPDDLWTNMFIHFSSKGSYDGDGEGSISFTWDFDDGTEPSNLANPIHIYEEPGTYNVTLTVIDNNNVIAQDIIVITIQRNYGDNQETEGGDWTNAPLGVFAALAAFATACVVVVFYRRRKM